MVVKMKNLTNIHFTRVPKLRRKLQASFVVINILCFFRVNCLL